MKGDFMRKSLFLTLVLSLCVADLGAFAATRADARAGTTNSQVEKTVARSVVRSVTPGSSVTGGNVAQRGRVATAPVTTGVSSSSVSAPSATRSAKSVVAARSATTKKALSMGTKVATATENTVVSEECQNAYYGCMDAFCMLDNAAGGRCQCSDRVVELNAVMDEIMKIDEQSSRIASEGVEKVQMGQYADQITNRAKDVENDVTSVKAAKTPSLNLIDVSSLISSNIFDDGTEDVFESDNNMTAIDDVASKTGDNLQKAAAQVCVAQIPAECKTKTTLLQMAYSQKVRSDCVGYENALKQQKSVSQQNLLAAQKAVRDAVLTDVREKNKYETTGECALAFAQCMQTTAGCASDYTGCVTLAAAENVKSTKTGSIAKQTRIKGVVSGADITLAASTMESLLAKKEICASVTRQCVNANKDDAVWTVFLRNAAPALKSAELVAEQNLRSNCIPSAAECFKNACKSQFGDNNDSYDICLSNPLTYKSLCKVQLEPCLQATGGTFENPESSTLWNGLVAMLNSMKVDACTKEVKDCLLSEDRCGPDYAGCIGLDTQSIGNLCPTEKLTACMDNYNKDSVRQYVAEVAQGLALQIDNSLVDACQKAANEAMIKICGDTESCDNAMLNLDTLSSMMSVQACKGNDNSNCYADVSQFLDDDIYALEYSDVGNAEGTGVEGVMQYVESQKLTQSGTATNGVQARLVGQPEMSKISYEAKTTTSDSTEVPDYEFRSGTNADDNTTKVVALLNNALNNIMGQIDSDPKVTYCTSGRKVQGFNDDFFIGTKTSRDAGKSKGTYKNLTNEYKYIVANSLLGKLSEKNAELTEQFSKQMTEMNKKISERVASIAAQRGGQVEQRVDAMNQAICDGYEEDGTGIDWDNETAENNCGQTRVSKLRSWVNIEPVYDAETNVCTKRVVKYNCEYWRAPWFCHSFCAKADEGTVVRTEDIQLSKFQ